ncbi:MAG: hypothetical protein RL115_793 [Bacteroidota bacterium]|jgi:hypothetical protein
MIHIVFNEYEVALMQQVMELDALLQGEVLLIRDDFAVGPLANIDTAQGWETRVQWWQQLLANSPHIESTIATFDDRQTVNELKEKLQTNAAEEVWIWMGQNQHDVCGYYWLMPQLREFQGRVMVLYMNNLPFINEKGQIFYPSWLGEIQPKEFTKAKKLARPVTLSEFEIDPDEWRKMMDENATVRILEGGKKIAGKEESYYDTEIIKNVTGDWQKANRVITNTCNRMKVKTGDIFLMWRLKQLIAEAKIEANGDLNKGWKDFEVKKQGAKQGEMALDATQNEQ